MYGDSGVASAMHALHFSRDDRQSSASSSPGGGCVFSLLQCHSPKLDITFLELNSILYSHNSKKVDLEIDHEVPLQWPW